MLFSSITFLYYFLPAVILLYFLVPKKIKNLALLLCSLFFYGWGEPKYLIFLSTAIIQGYVFGLLIEKFRDSKKLSRLFLVASLAISLGMLGYFKYADFFIANFNSIFHTSLPLLSIALPIGISFYTFQLISYSVDVFNEKAAAQRNFINFATYISMFPQLVAGPIVRYSDISNQLESRKYSLDGISEGVKRFIFGLAKKVIIANVLGEIGELYKSSTDKSIIFIWFYAISFALQIYYDFSGYSDMAIGIGKILGFDFPENFNYPYVSRSITEFWRRWHMSLGSWFRDYVYIPLGGNRVPKLRWIFNIFVVWMATGFWHGASWNFIIWGIWFAVLLLIEKIFINNFLSKHVIFSHFYVILCLIISFVIFDNIDLGNTVNTLFDMFGFSKVNLLNSETIYILRSYGFLIVISILGATALPKKIFYKIKEIRLISNILSILEPIFLVLLLLISTAFLVDGSFNPFLYFRF